MITLGTVRVHNIMVDWLRESGVKNVALDIKYNEGKRILTIYSEHPGYLIGKAGCISDKYIPLIKKEDFNEVDLKTIESIIRMEEDKVDVDSWTSDYFMARGF